MTCRLAVMLLICYAPMTVFADPANIARLMFRLDGGPERRIAIGPDEGRLAHAGDFNVEISVQSLLPTSIGKRHCAELIAYDHDDRVYRPAIEFNFDPGIALQLPSRIKRPETGQLQDAVQIVDGL